MSLPPSPVHADAEAARRSPISLHWVCPARTPYWSYLLGALAADPAVDLTVHYVRRSHPLYPWRGHWEDSFEHRVFARGGVDLQILRLAADRRQRLAVCGWQTPGLVALLLELAALGRPYLFFTDTPVPRPRPLLKRTARNAVVRTVLRSASVVMTTGAPGVEALKELGCPADKLVELPYFCDPAAFRRPFDPSEAGDAADPDDQGGASGPRDRSDPAAPAAPADDGALRIVSCGRLIPVKSYDVALHAVASLKRTAPDVRFRYDIAGAGPAQPSLRSLADRLGLAADVRFRGWLEPEEVSALLQRCDLFLHPAAREPYGVAVLEAMAAGAAVLGSAATGAVRDRIVQGSNGLVHPTGDAELLAAQIADLATDRARLRRLGRAAAATADAWPASRGVAIVKDALARASR